MKIKLALVFLSFLFCRPLAGYADQNLHSRFQTALNNTRSITNVEVIFLDTLSIKDSAALKVLKVENGEFSRTLLYSFLASGQKYRASDKFISSTETNLNQGSESAFDGKSYRAYDLDARRMTKNCLNRPLEGLDAMNPLIMPFKFLEPSFDGHVMRLLNFTDLTSSEFAKGFALPQGQKTNGVLEITVRGVPLENQQTIWKISVDENSDVFTPKTIEHIFPASGREIVMRLLNYTNLGSYQFPSRVEWMDAAYPPTTPPTLTSTGMLTLVSVRMPDQASDSVFELKSEEELADSIWDWATKSFERVVPTYPSTNACVPYLGPMVYDETANGSKQIDDAIAVAKKERKRVLLEFGANWSNPCQQFHTFLETNQSVTSELGKDYVIVMVDINREHNRDVESMYGHPTHFGLPALVVLNFDGKQLASEKPLMLKKAGDYNLEKTLDFLRTWAPENNH